MDEKGSIGVSQNCLLGGDWVDWLDNDTFAPRWLLVSIRATRLGGILVDGDNVLFQFLLIAKRADEIGEKTLDVCGCFGTRLEKLATKLSG